MHAPPPEHVAEFVVKLLNVGHAVVPLIESLADAVSETTGESAEAARHQVLAMCMATITARLASTSREDVQRATHLVDGTLAAILDDLRRAATRREAPVRCAHG